MVSDTVALFVAKKKPSVRALRTLTAKNDKALLPLRPLRGQWHDALPLDIGDDIRTAEYLMQSNAGKYTPSLRRYSKISVEFCAPYPVKALSYATTAQNS